jgi:hypothetical protein
MRPIYKIIAVWLILGGNISTARAGNIEMIRDTLDPLVELMNIQNWYMTTTASESDLTGPGTGGTFTYKYYEYSNDSVTYLFTDTFALKVFGNRFSFETDSIKLWQDYQYNVLVYKTDSIIHVRRPINFYEAIFQVDLLDTSLFRQVQSYRAFDSASARYIIFEFKNESPLIRLTVKADILFHQMKELEFTMKKDIVPGGTAWQPPSSYHNYTRVHILANTQGITNPYSTFDFDTGRVIKLQNGVLVPTSTYQNFEVVNELDK